LRIKTNYYTPAKKGIRLNYYISAKERIRLKGNFLL
jgi:hypothetical protein